MQINEAAKIVEAFSTSEHVRSPDEKNMVRAVTFSIDSPSWIIILLLNYLSIASSLPNG